MNSRSLLIYTHLKKLQLNKLIGDYIPIVQKPRAVLSDNGTQFTARRWKSELDAIDIKVKFISVYFPQGNITERYNREIGRLLRCYCHEKHTKWAYTLEFVEKCLNRVISDSTGYTPLFLQTGRNEISPLETIVEFPKENEEQPILEHCWVLARHRLKSRGERRAAKANVGKNLVVFGVGDQVLVRSHTQSSAAERTIHKFFLLYEGPYRVLRQAGPNSYVVGTEDGREIAKHNVVNLKRYKTPVDK